MSDYHTDRDEFIFHDPGINAGNLALLLSQRCGNSDVSGLADYCRITSAQLDDARHAFGTDEDILEISLG